MRQLFFGTTNAGKLRELRRLVQGLDLEVVSPVEWPEPLPEVEETGVTFEENARTKALAYARLTGLPALADDSGLCVDGLGGAPGVRSARWSADAPGTTSPACSLGEVAEHELGPEAARHLRDARNNEKLLTSLGGVPDEKRGAGYVAVLVLAAPDDQVLAQVRGECRGRIGLAPRGSGGFGYDPLFLPGGGAAQTAPGHPHRTMAELSAAEKDAISHRGAAFRALRPALEELARRPTTAGL